MKHIHTLTTLLILTLIVAAFALPVQAQIGEVTPPDFIQRWINVDGGEDGGALIFIFATFLRILLIGAGFFALWQFITSGYMFMTSGGDPQKLGEARNKLLMTLVGLAVIASSFVIAAIVGIIFFQDAMAILSPTIIGAPPATP